MRPSRFVPLLPLLVALVVTGCDASSAGEGSGNGPGGPTSTAPHSTAASVVPTATTGVPTPSGSQTATLLAALGAVDSDLATDPTGAVANAVSLCSALRNGRAPSDAVPSTFPDVSLDASQQQAVATAVTSSFCPLTGGSAGASSSGSGSASPTPSGSGS